MEVGKELECLMKNVDFIENELLKKDSCKLLPKKFEAIERIKIKTFGTFYMQSDNLEDVSIEKCSLNDDSDKKLLILLKELFYKID